MNVALIGISGWGAEMLGALTELDSLGELSLTVISDIQYELNRAKIEELGKSGTQYYQDYTEMLGKEKDLDIVVIATPIQLHRPMAIAAMEAGFHVFLEKPPAVTIQDVDAIIAASQRTSRRCAVDFLNASSGTFLELKRYIAAGALGDIRTITGVGLWQRLDSYYSRTNWAGKLVVNGNYVLDGTVNNPLSHLLNNMMLLGQAAPNSGGASVASVTAELYHAHDIEGEDNSCVRIVMGGGVELYFYASLCHDGQETPNITVEGTKGTACWDYAQKMSISAEGVSVCKEPADQEAESGHMLLLTNMLRNLIAVVSGREDRLYCSVQDTRRFVLASNGAFESSGGTRAIPSRFYDRIPQGDSVATHVRGINGLIHQAAAQHRLFSEMGVEWAVPGRVTNMEGYDFFGMKF